MPPEIAVLLIIAMAAIGTFVACERLVGAATLVPRYAGPSAASDSEHGRRGRNRPSRSQARWASSTESNRPNFIELLMGSD